MDTKPNYRWYWSEWRKEWVTINGPEWPSHLTYAEGIEKPTAPPNPKVTMGGYTFNLPDAGGFLDGQIYYLPNILDPNKPEWGIWPQSVPSVTWMQLVHKNREDAISHAKALLSFNHEQCVTVAKGVVDANNIKAEGSASHETP